MRKFLAAIGLLTLAGCTTTETAQWVYVDGDKAAGTVTLGIDSAPKFGIAETHIVTDIDQANEAADKHCKSLGYDHAAIYNDDTAPIRQTCHGALWAPCWGKDLRIKYQCVQQ